MNKLTIIGNLTRDPELRTTKAGTPVCTFTVAVNRRKASDQSQPEADFFHVTVWRQLGEICHKYLAKGRKVCVIGPVSISTYTGADAKAHASLEVTADDVEFLSSKQDAAPAAQQAAPAAPAPAQTVMGEDDELPF